MSENAEMLRAQACMIHFDCSISSELVLFISLSG